MFSKNPKLILSEKRTNHNEMRQVIHGWKSQLNYLQNEFKGENSDNLQNEFKVKIRII